MARSDTAKRGTSRAVSTNQAQRTVAAVRLCLAQWPWDVAGRPAQRAVGCMVRQPPSPDMN